MRFQLEVFLCIHPAEMSEYVELICGLLVPIILWSVVRKLFLNRLLPTANQTNLEIVHTFDTNIFLA